MRRSLIYIILIVAAMLVPAERLDVGKLQPMKLVYISNDANGVRLETDTGDSGTGETVEKAFRNLKETTPGIIFLDTADYLLVNKGAEDLIDDMNVYLKEDVRICCTEDIVDLTAAAEYLTVHEPQIKLRDWKYARSTEWLAVENDRMKIVEKTENNT